MGMGMAGMPGGDYGSGGMEGDAYAGSAKDVERPVIWAYVFDTPNAHRAAIMAVRV